MRISTNLIRYECEVVALRLVLIAEVVHSSPQEEILMDEALNASHEATDQEEKLVFRPL